MVINLLAAGAMMGYLFAVHPALRRAVAQMGSA
jgi:hypothetical protein